MSAHDVYSFGMVSSSTLYRISGAFPAAEGYAEIDAKSYMTGGEATNSSIVLSRLGARVRLDGNWLGEDEAGRRGTRPLFLAGGWLTMGQVLSLPMIIAGAILIIMAYRAAGVAEAKA